MAEDVCDLGLPEAGGVVFEGEMALGVVELEAAEAVGIGKFGEGAELVVSQGRLEFEFGFEECHAVIIAKGGEEKDGADFRPKDSALAFEIEERSPFDFAQGRLFTLRSRAPKFGANKSGAAPVGMTVLPCTNLRAVELT